jgi:lytic cellulose monooxygenase (C1-hydroxylating)
MAALNNPEAKPQDLKFFKIDQAGFDQKTHTWASDRLIAENNSWISTIPSDIKPGKYVVRHELIALQFASDGNPEGAGTVTAGAQFYPICLNVEVTGTGTQTPSGVNFPGGYKPSEPGIIYDLFEGTFVTFLLIRYTR